MTLLHAPVLDDAVDRDPIRNALDETLVVEAAAGTGKTTELVARIVRLVATGQREDRRDRRRHVHREGRRRAEAAHPRRSWRRRVQRSPSGAGPVPSDACPAGRSSARLDDALAHLEEAHVSTIHGFCADLLRERPVEARRGPRVRGPHRAAAPSASSTAPSASGSSSELEDPPEGVRRALRRLPPAWSPYADDEDGPVARLRKAAVELREWRDLARAVAARIRSTATRQVAAVRRRALRVRRSHRDTRRGTRTRCSSPRGRCACWPRSSASAAGERAARARLRAPSRPGASPSTREPPSRPDAQRLERSRRHRSHARPPREERVQGHREAEGQEAGLRQGRDAPAGAGRVRGAEGVADRVRARCRRRPRRAAAA